MQAALEGGWLNRPRCDQTAAWERLASHYRSAGRVFDLRRAFADDPGRFERLSQTAPGLFADLSRGLADAQTWALLLQLARECGVEVHRDAMFAGEPINSTEGRAALHTLLRVPPNAQDAPVAGRLAAELAEVHAARESMLAFAARVRDDVQITDVVNIGIGGSDLGPRMAVEALGAYADAGKRLHFVSNIDGHELADVLQLLQPQNTLFLIASKTFTTLETMTNARSAKRWFEAGGETDVARHFVGITTRAEVAHAFGIRTTFGFRDWVGGRYSVWSAIGLPLAIAIGPERFREFLDGAYAMDRHFQTAPLAENLPVRLGLLDVWHRDFHGFSSRCLAPYHSHLRRLPAYLQQLEMESNGKRVDLHGQALAVASAPVVWGEAGTDGQHAFFQMLHQGTDVVPVEFVAVARAQHDLMGHHGLLLANALAQARALMLGHTDEGGHKDFPGNRPSIFLLLEELTPASLGSLIALQEHRVFVTGSLWGLDSFDQWGVELGKQLAQDLAPRLASGDVDGLDPATAGLLRVLRRNFEEK